MSSTSTSTYVLGRSEQEYERLMLQSKLLRPFTDRYFRTAGVSPGMRVLDVGSGMGDVALLAGEIVGCECIGACTPTRKGAGWNRCIP